MSTHDKCCDSCANKHVDVLQSQREFVDTSGRGPMTRTQARLAESTILQPAPRSVARMLPIQAQSARIAPTEHTAPRRIELPILVPNMLLRPGDLGTSEIMPAGSFAMTSSTPWQSPCCCKPISIACKSERPKKSKPDNYTVDFAIQIELDGFPPGGMPCDCTLSWRERLRFDNWGPDERRGIPARRDGEWIEMTQLEIPATMLNVAPGGKLRCCDPFPLGCIWSIEDHPQIRHGTILDIEVTVSSCQSSFYCGDNIELKQLVSFVAPGVTRDPPRDAPRARVPVIPGLYYSRDNHGGDTQIEEFEQPR